MPKKLLDVMGTIGKAAAETLPEYAIRVSDGFYSRGAEGFQDIIKEVRGGHCVHYYSDGAWSHHDLVKALLDITGKCEMFISTYAMSETAVRMLSAAKDAGIIKALHCLVDNRIDTRTAGSLQLLKSIATSCVLVPCHAKVTVMLGHACDIAVVTSANYTENKRIEAGLVTSSGNAANFHARWIEDQIKQNGSNRA